jgi:lipopolysaccharide/colanic/teichoic acid biosynthesis glycosyltransferase
MGKPTAMKEKIRQSILVFDLTWILAAFSLAYALRYRYLGFGAESWTSFQGFVPALCSALLIWVFLFLSKNLDGFTGGWHLPTVLSQITIAVLYLMAFLLALAFLQRHYYSRLLLLYLACLLPIGFAIIRCLARWFIASKLSSPFMRRAVILGSGHVAQELALKISRHPELLLQVVGLLYPSSSDSASGLGTTSNEMTSLRSLNVHNFLEEKNVKELIVVMPQSGGSDTEKVISKCREAGMVVRLVPHWYQLHVSEAQMIEIDGVPLISLEERNIPAAALALKRIVDFIGGSILAVLTLPILLIAILKLHRLHGRALSKEQRCGAFGCTFSMFRLNVDRESAALIGFEKLLARLSLTELPQLWNVIRGEMSLVGPRPEAPERVRHYSDWQRQRLSVKPGLTGLAQVHGLREAHSSNEKARFDLEYIFHWSLFLDFSLVLQTAWTIIVRLLSSQVNSAALVVEAPAGVKITIKEMLNADRSQSSAD